LLRLPEAGAARIAIGLNTIAAISKKALRAWNLRKTI